MKLFLQAVTKFIMGLILVGVLLFLPAGTFKYNNAWLFIVVLFVPMFIFGIILLFKDPELLKMRLDAKEKETDQKIVILFSALMFISGFILAGLNFRYKWIKTSNITVIIGAIIFIISYILYAEVLRENKYLSRTIGTTKNQKVIDTGMYSLVRHPMYMITIPLFLSIPVILGSPISFVIFIMYPFIIIKRINNEEKVLEKELKGYKEYKKKVKYKLIPFIY